MLQAADGLRDLTPLTSRLRVSDREREFAARHLHDAACAGALSVTEFDRRLDRALSAATRGELEAVLLDLPVPRPTRGSRWRRWLRSHLGAYAIVNAGLIAIWAAAGFGYFWPVWPIMAIAVVLVVQTAAIMLTSRDQTELTERIESLENTRAGAVDAQESELRRIERDLHDGAQARLVALGMSLGMAEHNLERDPERAGELLAEARVGAEQALRELRDLARGIHPPVLADRGLAAAVETLADSTPMRVWVSVDIGERPPSAVESAAYFVAAEALANAVKHARAEHVDIRVARVVGTLELDVTDDGVGGANPNGGGLSGLRRRVEALDGSLGVISPPGGPTTVHAELPCG